MKCDLLWKVKCTSCKLCSFNDVHFTDSDVLGGTYTIQWLHDNEVPCHNNNPVNMVILIEEQKKYLILELLLVIISVHLSILHQQRISMTMIALNFTYVECFFIVYEILFSNVIIII